MSQVLQSHRPQTPVVPNYALDRMQEKRNLNFLLVLFSSTDIKASLHAKKLSNHKESPSIGNPHSLQQESLISRLS